MSWYGWSCPTCETYWEGTSCSPLSEWCPMGCGDPPDMVDGEDLRAELEEAIKEMKR